MNWQYIETPGSEIRPVGQGWEYWSDRIVLDENGNEVEHVAVWRRDADVYGTIENGV